MNTYRLHVRSDEFQYEHEVHATNVEKEDGWTIFWNGNNVFMRIDVGFSHEGYQVSVKFNDLFRRGPVHTSSVQEDF